MKGWSFLVIVQPNPETQQIVAQGVVVGLAGPDNFVCSFNTDKGYRYSKIIHVADTKDFVFFQSTRELSAFLADKFSQPKLPEAPAPVEKAPSEEPAPVDALALPENVKKFPVDPAND